MASDGKLRIKYLLTGLILGLLIGGVAVYISDKYNLPVIEKIKYITLPQGALSY